MKDLALLALGPCISTPVAPKPRWAADPGPFLEPAGSSWEWGALVAGHHQPLSDADLFEEKPTLKWSGLLPHLAGRDRFLKPNGATHPSYKCLTCDSFTNETKVKSLVLFIVWFFSTLQHSKILEAAVWKQYLNLYSVFLLILLNHENISGEIDFEIDFANCTTIYFKIISV